MKNEELVLRMNLIGGMNSFVREHIEDENILGYWFRCGFPDGGDETDAREIAEVDEFFTDLVNAFAKCVKASLED